MEPTTSISPFFVMLALSSKPRRGQEPAMNQDSNRATSARLTLPTAFSGQFSTGR